MVENTMSSLLNWAAYAHRVVFESIRCQKVYFWMHLENSVTDFISSALAQQVNGAGLLHTTYGTPKHVALEVQTIEGQKNIRGYIWGKNETFICTICRKIYQEH
ncbi:putative non-specific serine/threonine protein kinase [Helianthus annuus]|nr:putative non-specific serine/threonine protein kinase [Helianthus annuus]